jgi:hypothetical protein
MADYFLVLDGARFENEIRPALAASWRRRNFGPCRPLCAALTPAARAYAQRYHTGGAEPVVGQVARGLPFDRHFWRALVGEVLLFAADEIPEFQTCADTLCCLLAPEHYRATVRSPHGHLPREQLPPIRQAHEGSRDLTFGAAVYRPEHAGYNNGADVARLADYLDSVRPESWTPASLEGLRDAADEGECADELAFAREWFPVLRDLYRGARERGRVLAHESIY